MRLKLLVVGAIVLVGGLFLTIVALGGSGDAAPPPRCDRVENDTCVFECPGGIDPATSTCIPPAKSSGFGGGAVQVMGFGGTIVGGLLTGMGIVGSGNRGAPALPEALARPLRLRLGAHDEAMSHLRMRLARGEITVEEYERVWAVLRRA